MIPNPDKQNKHPAYSTKNAFPFVKISLLGRIISGYSGRWPEEQLALLITMA